AQLLVVLRERHRPEHLELGLAAHVHAGAVNHEDLRHGCLLSGPAAAHCGLIPACFTTRVHLSVSATTYWRNASWLRWSVSAPAAAKCLTTSACCRISLTSRSSRPTIAFEVPAGTTMPHQFDASYPGTPDSSMVGTSGSAATRFFEA